MDSIRIIMFLFIIMITLDFNLAVSVDLAEKDHPVVGGHSILQPIFRRFDWRSLTGKPVARSRRRHRSNSFVSDDEDTDNAKPRAVYWIPTSCDPLVERGYTCLACGESLHCMAGGFALKAICGGLRPFCHNGICSYTRGEKCNKNNSELAAQFADVDPTSGNVTIASDSADMPTPGMEEKPGIQKVTDDEQLHDLQEVSASQNTDIPISDESKGTESL